MYCIECGATNLEGSKFCTRCGIALTQVDQASSESGLEALNKAKQSFQEYVARRRFKRYEGNKHQQIEGLRPSVVTQSSVGTITDPPIGYFFVAVPSKETIRMIQQAIKLKYLDYKAFIVAAYTSDGILEELAPELPPHLTIYSLNQQVRFGVSLFGAGARVGRSIYASSADLEKSIKESLGVTFTDIVKCWNCGQLNRFVGESCTACGADLRADRTGILVASATTLVVAGIGIILLARGFAEAIETVTQQLVDPLLQKILVSEWWQQVLGSGLAAQAGTWLVDNRRNLGAGLLFVTEAMILLIILGVAFAITFYPIRAISRRSDRMRRERRS